MDQNITFAISLVFVAALFFAKVGNIERSMFRAFITENVIYYAIGIILTYAFKDNRAFCKYRHKKRNEQLSRRIIAYQTKNPFPLKRIILWYRKNVNPIFEYLPSLKSEYKYHNGYFVDPG